MDSRIQGLIRLAFDGLPYSREIDEARGRIGEALSRQYEAFQKEADGDAFEKLSARYASLTAMAELAGYGAADAQSWRKKEKAISRKEAAKAARRSAALFFIFSFFMMFFLSPYVNPKLSALLAALIYGVKTLAEKRLNKTYDTEAHDYLRARMDRYIKRSMYSEAVFFIILGMYLLSTLFSAFPDQAKLSEVAHVINAFSPYLAAASYYCFLNRIRIFKYRDVVSHERVKRIRRHFWVFGGVSLLYWTLCGIVLYFLFSARDIPVLPFIIMMSAYVLGVMGYTFFPRRRITDRNLVFSRKKLITAAAVLLIAVFLKNMYKDTWYTQPFINTTPVVSHGDNHIAYNEENGVYTITSAQEEFKILQLTDIHLGGSLISYGKDVMAMEACFRLIESTHPDLVVVSGDLCYPVGISSLSFNNRAPIAQFAAFMRNTGVPWAFTFGNHDTESFAAESDLNGVFCSLSYYTSGNLLYPYVQPEISGRSNQLIEIRNADGTLNQALFLIDSNAYLGRGFSTYDYIHDDQVEWYEREVMRLCDEEGRLISSLAFFHIPLQQYRTAYQLYEQGSGEVTYFFGENGEKLYDKVCCSKYPSAFFDTAKRLGSTKAMFCGHDHFNNISLEYEGIRLTYGMSIDYLATPGTDKSDAQRGATLITLHKDSSYDIEQVPYAPLKRK